jgi:hypothetical protein
MEFLFALIAMTLMADQFGLFPAIHEMNPVSSVIQINKGHSCSSIGQ